MNSANYRFSDGLTENMTDTQDIGLPVQNITTQVNWKKHRGGKTIVTSTQFLGYLGIHTGNNNNNNNNPTSFCNTKQQNIKHHNVGMRAGGWSVQANERVVLSPGPIIGYQPAILLETVSAFLEGHEPVGKFLRETLLVSIHPPWRTKL